MKIIILQQNLSIKINIEMMDELASHACFLATTNAVILPINPAKLNRLHMALICQILMTFLLPQ